MAGVAGRGAASGVGGVARGAGAATEAGRRRLNWVWYVNVPAGAPLERLLIDRSGERRSLRYRRETHVKVFGLAVDRLVIDVVEHRDTAIGMQIGLDLIAHQCAALLDGLCHTGARCQLENRWRLGSWFGDWIRCGNIFKVGFRRR